MRKTWVRAAPISMHPCHFLLLLLYRRCLISLPSQPTSSSPSCTAVVWLVSPSRPPLPLSLSHIWPARGWIVFKVHMRYLDNFSKKIIKFRPKLKSTEHAFSWKENISNVEWLSFKYTLRYHLDFSFSTPRLQHVVLLIYATHIQWHTNISPTA